MVGGMQEVVGLHVLNHLLVHCSLHDLGQDREERHRAVVLGIGSFILLVQRDNLGHFPSIREGFQAYGQVYYVSDGWNKLIFGKFDYKRIYGV